MKTFVVTRNNWFRGQGEDKSALLRPDGRMCCLGHVSLQCGIDRSHIFEEVAPQAVRKDDWDKYPEGIRPFLKTEYFKSVTQKCYDMMEVNDDPDIMEEKREEKLSALAKEAGFELLFVTLPESQAFTLWT